MTSTAIVTGATGYIGSHLAASLLQTEGDRVVICLARRSEIASAERVYQALAKACQDQGLEQVPETWHNRISVWEEDLTERGQRHTDNLPERESALQSAEFWHCAASIKFTESRDQIVRTMNIEGLRRTLEIARRLQVRVFNHVSTAYVAGSRTGVIREELTAGDYGFNNVYEESKSHGERLVHQFCGEHALAYRILRPSIVVGHSQTRRSSSNAGIYRVAELSKKFQEMVEARTPGYFSRQPLRLALDPDGTFNTIPVDLVVAEMLDLAQCGQATWNQVFHLTSERPQNSWQALSTFLPLVGIPQVELAASPTELNSIDRLYAKGVKAYMPYLNGRQIFQRTNVRHHGADRHQAAYHGGLDSLLLFSEHYLGILAKQDNSETARQLLST